MTTINLGWCLWHHPTGTRLQAVQHSYLIYSWLYLWLAIDVCGVHYVLYELLLYQDFIIVGGEEYWMPCVINLWRVTWLPVLHTWLSKELNTRIFSRLWKVEAFFMIFVIDSTRMLVFAQYHTLICLHSKPHPQYLNCAFSIFEFLAHDFPKTSYTEYVVHSTLSSLPYYIIFLNNYTSPTTPSIQN